MKLGHKINYGGGILPALKQEVRPEVMRSAVSSPELRKEIARVFQMANRRIQNIESKGLLSPAVAALNKGDIKRYSKFSMSSDWETLKIEYAKAVSFLRQPTSTARGTRQYNRHIQQAFNLTSEEFDIMAKGIQNKIMSLSETDFVERYLMRYKDFTGELETAARDVSGQIESEAEQIHRVIEEEFEESVENAALELESHEENTKRIIDTFKKFGL